MDSCHYIPPVSLIPFLSCFCHQFFSSWIPQFSQIFVITFHLSHPQHSLPVSLNPFHFLLSYSDSFIDFSHPVLCFTLIHFLLFYGLTVILVIVLLSQIHSGCSDYRFSSHPPEKPVIITGICCIYRPFVLICSNYRFSSHPPEKPVIITCICCLYTDSLC